MSHPLGQSKLENWIEHHRELSWAIAVGLFLVAAAVVLYPTIPYMTGEQEL